MPFALIISSHVAASRVGGMAQVLALQPFRIDAAPGGVRAVPTAAASGCYVTDRRAGERDVLVPRLCLPAGVRVAEVAAGGMHSVARTVPWGSAAPWQSAPQNSHFLQISEFLLMRNRENLDSSPSNAPSGQSTRQ